MKLREILKVFSREKPHHVSFVDVAQYLDIQPRYDYNNNVWDDNVKQYYVASWYCTDTIVGFSVITFKDAPVLVCTQTGRKSDRIFDVVDLEQMESFREFIVKEVISTDHPSYRLADLDTELGTHYTVDYADGLLQDNVVYQGKQAEVIKKFDRGQWDKISRVVIKTIDGEEIEVEVSDLHIPFNIVSE